MDLGSTPRSPTSSPPSKRPRSEIYGFVLLDAQMSPINCINDKHFIPSSPEDGELESPNEIAEDRKKSIAEALSPTKSNGNVEVGKKSIAEALSPSKSNGNVEVGKKFVSDVDHIYGGHGSKTGDVPSTSSAAAGAEQGSKKTLPRHKLTPEERIELAKNRAKLALERKVKREEKKRLAEQRKAERKVKKMKKTLRTKNVRRQAQDTDDSSSESDEDSCESPRAKKRKIFSLLNLTISSSESGEDGEGGFDSNPKKKRAYWAQFEQKLKPHNFAQNHPVIQIDTLRPWDANDLDTYYDYIDDYIMSRLVQYEAWKLILEYTVPTHDPLPHPIGTLKCCASGNKVQCPAMERAKKCFAKRIGVLYYFVFPFMKKYPTVLPLICDKMWLHVDEQLKTEFYRDNCKCGLFHEYISMVIQFPPTQQEGKIFAACYPDGNRASPRPTPHEILLPPSYYDRNPEELLTACNFQ